VSLTLSAVIPTRNRAADLCVAVESLLRQTRPPDELIIVDQSPGDESVTRVHALFSGVTVIRLLYIHDTTVSGLVDAKRVGSGRATGDIVCFLEDDVVLEAEYLAQIATAFEARPDMWGCSGVITNLPHTSPLYIALHRLFFRGIFRDPRVAVSVTALRASGPLIRCDVLSGGLSAWRREVFARIPFDTSNHFFMFEDMEFSTRVVRAFGPHLYVNPGARLEHKGSPVNRDDQGVRQRRKLTEAVTFYKKRRDWPGALTGLLGVMCWSLGEAVQRAATVRSAAPVAGYFRGVIDGFQRPLVRQEPERVSSS